MAITISGDLAHMPSRTVEAAPYGEEQAARFAQFKEWKKKTERDLEVDWIISKAHISQNRQLSFPFDEELVPTRMQLTNGKVDWDYSGFMGLPNANAVGQRFKDIIESVEPGIHQFLPFELYDQEGKLIDKPLYFWRVCTSLDAISPELGGVKPLGLPDNHSWQINPGDGRRKLAVKKDVIEGRAAWCDVRMPSRQFISDLVVTKLNEQQLTGWEAIENWKEI